MLLRTFKIQNIRKNEVFTSKNTQKCVVVLPPELFQHTSMIGKSLFKKKIIWNTKMTPLKIDLLTFPNFCKVSYAINFFNT